MAEAVSVNNTSGKLSCSICQKKMQEMTVSSCFHTFCKDCLIAHSRSMPTKTHYVCPICKTTIKGVLNEPGYKLGAGEYRYGDDKFINNYCDICTDGKMAVNRCLQCDESFCESCTNAHLKMKVSKYHGQRVVPLHHLGLRDSRAPMSAESSQKFCLRHRNEEIIVVCKECDVMLCLVCKLMEHENHVTKLVSEEAGELRQNLSSLLDKQTGYSENLQLRIKMVGDRKVKFPRDLEQELTKVRYQTTKLHQEVEKGKSVYEKELMQHYNGHIDTNNESLQSLKQEYEEYVQASKEAQDILNSNNDVLAIRKGNGLYDKLNKIEMDSQVVLDGEVDAPNKRFAAGNIDEGSLQNMMGNINQRSASLMNIQDRAQRMPSARNRMHQPNHLGSASRKRTRTQKDYLNIKHVSVFNLLSTDGVGYVYGIAPIRNQQAWVTMLDHSHVTLIDKHGHPIRTVELGEPCDGVASDGNDGCFVTCPITKCIRHVKQNGEIKTIVADLPKIPHGISALRSYNAETNSMLEELYVCFTDTKPEYVFGNQLGCLKVFSFSGEDLKTISFKCPVRVATTPETDLIAVADGCVTITDRSGKSVKALYTGRYDSNEKIFRPLGVCFDKYGYVIVADWKGGRVRRIRPDGSWAQDIATELKGPQTVAVGTDGLLWIGSKQGHIDVFEID